WTATPALFAAMNITPKKAILIMTSNLEQLSPTCQRIGFAQLVVLPKTTLKHN
ncbi:Rubredoxin, partial [uncultured Coleofasciculus sp.]